MGQAIPADIRQYQLPQYGDAEAAPPAAPDPNFVTPQKQMIQSLDGREGQARTFDSRERILELAAAQKKADREKRAKAATKRKLDYLRRHGTVIVSGDL